MKFKEKVALLCSGMAAVWATGQADEDVSLRDVQNALGFSDEVFDAAYDAEPGARLPLKETDHARAFSLLWAERAARLRQGDL